MHKSHAGLRNKVISLMSERAHRPLQCRQKIPQSSLTAVEAVPCAKYFACQARSDACAFQAERITDSLDQKLLVALPGAACKRYA